jgi:mRNA interferase MazF
MIQRGCIYNINDTDNIKCGSEQKGYRPGVIVSNAAANRFSSVVTVVYLTSKPKKKMPTHIKILSLSKNTPSVALCEQPCSISTERLGSYLGKVSNREMMQIERALVIQLGLSRYIALLLLRILRERSVINTMVESIGKFFKLDAQEDDIDEAG